MLQLIGVVASGLLLPSSVRTVTSFRQAGGVQFVHVTDRPRDRPLVMCADAEAALEQATAMCDRCVSMMNDECTPPTALADLKDAIASGDLPAVRVAQLSLLIEQTLSFDVSEDGVLSPTALDVSNKDDEEVMGKYQYLYSYGIKMFTAGLVPQDKLQQIVLEKLAARVGLDGPAFDKWLQVPAVV